MRHAGVILLPHDLAVDRAQAEHMPHGSLPIGAQQKDLVLPNHRAAVADAGQLGDPVVILLGPAAGNRLGFALAGAIGAAEASPFLPCRELLTANMQSSSENKTAIERNMARPRVRKEWRGGRGQNCRPLTYA